ncbi:MAG: PBP1A family penicillin-binding protein [Bdellovibrionales bacterium]|nr:PBP1A family penicillin-binding protein [Bdellovibrionales bacterium]
MKKESAKTGSKILRILGLTALFGLGVVALSAVLLVVYVNLVSVEIDQRIDQLKSARSSTFYAIYPEFEIGQKTSLEALEKLLYDTGYLKKESLSELVTNAYVWENRSGPTWLLTLNRGNFSGAGYPLGKRVVRVRFDVEDKELTVSEIYSQVDSQRLDRFAHPPKRLGHFFAGRLRNQHSVALSDIPVSVRLAFIAIEDQHFLDHMGVSLRGTLRALWTDLVAMKWVQGGSTITQQLMKNLFFSREKVITRKLKEALYAFVAEARHEKEDILEAYLNEVYLGQWNTHEIHGVSEAAQYYFNRSVFDLTLAQSATLASVIKGPAIYNPHKNPTGVIERRNLVLKQMLEADFILPSEYAKAIREPLGVASAARELDDAAYFMELVMLDLPENVKSRLDSDALTIYVTLNPYLQSKAANALSAHIDRMEEYYKDLAQNKIDGKLLQGALVAIDVPSCSVLALQGGRNFREAPFNRVLQGKRQPGSLFKPFVYLTAFDSPPKGESITPTTILDDSPFVWKYDRQEWEPQNYEKEFRGEVTLQEALQKSMNVPTARLAQMVGISPIVETMKRAGIESDIPKVPSIALGSAEVTPFELAQAYTTLARLGNRCVLRSYTKVFDESGALLQDAKLVEDRKLDGRATYETVKILQGVFTDGTAISALRSGLDLSNFAGKTGTTNDYKDAWFVGFSPDILVLVWVGYDVDTNMGYPGSVAALPIWVQFMKAAAPSLRGAAFRY